MQCVAFTGRQVIQLHHDAPMRIELGAWPSRHAHAPAPFFIVAAPLVLAAQIGTRRRPSSPACSQRISVFRPPPPPLVDRRAGDTSATVQLM